MRLMVGALLFMVLGSTGCEKSPRDKLQGKWIGESIRNVHADQQGRAEGWARGTRVEFAANKVTVGIPAESARTGTYTIAKADGNDLELVFKRPEGTEDRSRVRFTDDGKLAWTLKSGQEITLRRE